jgi:putative flippase GtrA
VKESVRIFRFATIGTLNALIIAAVVWLMMRCRSFDYITSNVTAYLIAQVHNFVWCRYWIFPTGGSAKFSLWNQLLLFTLAFAMAYGAQFLFLLTAVELFGVNEYLAQFLGLFIYGGVNFITNRRLTFKKM